MALHAANAARRARLGAIALVLTIGACSDAESDGESSGKAGTSGSGQSGGTGGSQSGGAAGKAGASGSASGGATGSAGAAATGGSSGDGGGGSGGAGASGGSGASGGTGGSGGSRDGCKRGVAYGHHSEADMAALSPAVSWWYNWAYVPDQGVRSGAYTTLGVEYVPMVWGGSFNDGELVSDIPSGADFLLGFNEPNFYSQANLSASEAAALWPRVEQIAADRNLALVSPAVNFCGGGCHDTNPFDYLDDFFAACQGCRVDYIGIHIYVGCNANGQNKAQWMIDHINTYKSRFDKPFWLTEFACDDAATMEQQRDFMVDAVTYLENEPRIQRYAWFAGRADNVDNASLLGEDGMLTLLGQTYVDLPHNSACTN